MTTQPNWQRHGTILAFPYGWQQPAKTEQWAYERLLADHPKQRFIQFIGFPWATLIDLLRKGQNARAQHYLEALQIAPPKTTLIRATIM